MRIIVETEDMDVKKITRNDDRSEPPELMAELSETDPNLVNISLFGWTHEIRVSVDKGELMSMIRALNLEQKQEPRP